MTAWCSLLDVVAGSVPGTGQDMKLSERILFARRRAGLSQAGLAKALGVQRSAVSNWESPGAGRPATDNLIAIARATAVSLEWLATGRGRAAAAVDADDTVAAVDADLVEDPNERALLANFRALPHRQQLLALDLLKELSRGRKRG
jgi:transcriptional regulator with XRE-family HTH domain